MLRLAAILRLRELHGSVYTSPMQKPIRINKYLASVGVAARRKVDRLIEAGKVIVNGKKAILGQKIDPDADKIAVNGRLITPRFAQASRDGEGTENRIYIVLNKPKGVVSTVNDTHGRKTVIDLVRSDMRLFPVGRLDFESEGLMLLTNDGELANRLMHPRYHVPKAYLVRVVGRLGEDKLQMLRTGVKLTEGLTAPAKVEVISQTLRQTVLKMTISEGRNRQIRRMAEKLRLHVTKLQRIEIGPIDLGNLEIGTWRELTPEETASMKRVAGV